MGKLSLKIILLGLITHSLSFALILSQRPFLGYKNLPSARMMPQGRLLTSVHVAPKNHYDLRGELDKQLHLNLLTNPLSWLEWGAVFSHNFYKDDILTHRAGELGLKLQFPRIDEWQPYLSLGIVDVFEEDRWIENFYFVGSYSLAWRFLHFGVDVGSIYTRKSNIFDEDSPAEISSFGAIELDMGWVEILLETQWFGRRSFLWNASLWAKPLSPKPGMDRNLIALGAGVEKGSHGAKKAFWGGGQVQFPLEKLASADSAKQAKISLSFYPIFDHSFPKNAKNQKKQWQLNLGIDLATSLSASGLYWVNTFYPQGASSAMVESLPKRQAWQRSYLNFAMEQSWGSSFKLAAPQVALGLLEAGAAGLQVQQNFSVFSWHNFSLNARVLLDTAAEIFRDFHISLPLHPTLPGFLQYSQLRCEGGYYADQNWRLLGQIAQGTAKNHLVLGGGYNFNDNLWVFEAQMRFAWGKTSVGNQNFTVGYAPILEHHLSAEHSIYTGIQSIDGNASWRPQKLWKK